MKDIDVPNILIPNEFNLYNVVTICIMLQRIAPLRFSGGCGGQFYNIQLKLYLKIMNFGLKWLEKPQARARLSWDDHPCRSTAMQTATPCKV